MTLFIKDLSIRYPGEEYDTVKEFSVNIQPKNRIGLIGESGSGKSSVALAIMRLLEKQVKTGGEIYYKHLELTSCTEKQLNEIRWNQIAIVFQNSLDVLNPVLTVGEQLVETLVKHKKYKRKKAFEKAAYVMQLVGLGKEWLESYPHQLSGGMRQKVLIAMAIICEPEILIVDEPTMALDSMAKKEIVELLKKLQKEQGFAMLVISHEMPIIAELTDRVLVMYAGEIVEEGETHRILNHPMHPYTKGLVTASPALNPYRDLWGISGDTDYESPNRCPFSNRCNQAIKECFETKPKLTELTCGHKVSCVRGGIVTLLEGKGIKKVFQLGKKVVSACNDCYVTVKAGEIVSLIGQSGSGKSTLAEILAGVQKQDAGDVYFEGKKMELYSETTKFGGVQIVFQDPFTSINEQLKIIDIIAEPLDIIKKISGHERKREVIHVLQQVQLPTDDGFLNRKAYTLSGGQRQRIAIARALIMRPKLLIADEISSMLDPSNSANLLRRLKGIQNETGFAMLFVTHDLPLAQKISDRIYIMKQGEIVESGTVNSIYQDPKHTYTKELLSIGL